MNFAPIPSQRFSAGHIDLILYYILQFIHGGCTERGNIRTVFLQAAARIDHNAADQPDCFPAPTL